ncbi:ribosome biogenesis GTP-binding protein YihA/YsxC [Alicyclobacillus ferrooxydans]|uniref:Probable GTP-binding protein EngB n=1 Tax=Alicyclobacillus ferrooxydans TaxID=471514 RepID=A0A0N8PP34_9BACL|nr:ribosome biogenesis GTP-binding protein YihA/YsxC [Alicyclobacillus ferrooxydans]KPV43213.1 hypothetical protein AN477_13220 [Alicyclobacillus ferrooxydans]
MKIKSAEFEISAVRPGQWPDDGLPEFAFVGRSNVGKSSLLNRLLGRKSLARVSQKPGKTQQINFFRINEQFRFADLPGYGYAAVSKADRARFAKMMETYLTSREPLVRVFQLVDIRHPPMPMDIEVNEWMRRNGLAVTVVATKLDKVGKSHQAKAVRLIRTEMNKPESIRPVSSEKGQGIDELWSEIETLVATAQEQTVFEGSLNVSLGDSGAPSPESDTRVSNPHADENQ